MEGDRVDWEESEKKLKEVKGRDWKKTYFK